MNLQSDHRDDLVLPSWIGKIVAFIVLLVALGVIYYVFHDGILTQNIAYTTKVGKVGVGKGLIAIIIGLAFSGIGIGLIRVAWLILKAANRNKKTTTRKPNGR